MTVFTVKDDKHVLNTTGHSQNLIKSTLEYSNLGFQHYSTFTRWIFHSAQNSHTSRNICQCTECSICVYMYSNKHSKNKIITRIALVCVLLKPNC